MPNAVAGCNHITFYRPDGSTILFAGYAGRVGTYTEEGGGGLATLTGNTDGTYTLHDEDGTTQTYTSYGVLTSIKDEAGIGWTIANDAEGRPIKVTRTGGQFYTLAYAAEVTTDSYETTAVTVTDPAGHVYHYTATEFLGILYPYAGPYQVSSVTFPGTPATDITYRYTTSTPTQGQVLLSSTAINGTPYSSTTYTDGRATSTRLADGSEAMSIVYAFPLYGQHMVATVTNRLGHTKTMTYAASFDGQYLLTSVSSDAVADCGATTASTTFDDNGNLSRTVDNDGVVDTYSYAANGQLQSETEASGTSVARKIDYVWDPDQQLTRLASIAVEGDLKTSYTYTAHNRIASVTRTSLVGNSLSLKTSYAYTLYSDGMVHTMTVTAPSPNGSDHVTSTYDAHGNLMSVVDGLGHTTIYSGYNALGEVAKVVGPNGAETDYTYDARGRVASKTTHPNGGTATWTYAYDGFGLLAKIAAPDGEVTTWTRDAEKRVKTITHNDKDGTSTESFTYNANGNVTSDVIARGSDVGKAAYYSYDGLGRVYQVKGAHGQVTTYAYDGNGNVLSTTDALGHVTRYAYDALNRAVEKTGAKGGVTTYAYDAGGRVIEVKDPKGVETGYIWDGFGQMVDTESPDTGMTEYAYDAYGRVASKSRDDGTEIAYTYDALNRLTSEAIGPNVRTLTWDNCVNGIGRLCSATYQGTGADPVPPPPTNPPPSNPPPSNPPTQPCAQTGTCAPTCTTRICAQATAAAGGSGVSVDYSYTPEGWLAARGFSLADGTTYVLGYSYDSLGQVTQVAYPDGNEALYSYTDGAVSKINLQVGRYLVSGVTNISYRPMDAAMSAWTSNNGLLNSIGYDSDLRPTSITQTGVESLAFAYDADNRITHITNGMDGTQSETLWATMP